MSVSAVYERRARLGWPTGRPTTPVVILRHRVPVATEAPSKQMDDNPPSVTLPPLFQSPDTPNPILEAIRARSFGKQLVYAVCARFGIPFEEIASIRRSIETVRARQSACWLVKKFTTESLPSIGRRIGGKDHSTVLHAVRAIEARITHWGVVMPVPTVEPESPGDWQACIDLLATLEPLPGTHGRDVDHSARLTLAVEAYKAGEGSCLFLGKRFQIGEGTLLRATRHLRTPDGRRKAGA
jgi:hypothetical protein